MCLDLRKRWAERPAFRARMLTIWMCLCALVAIAALSRSSQLFPASAQSLVRNPQYRPSHSQHDIDTHLDAEPEPDPSQTQLNGLSSATESVYGDKVAILIETQRVPNLVPVMLHFAFVLGPTWKLVLFTVESTWVMPDSPPFLRMVESGIISIAFLPIDADFSQHYAVSVFLTRPWLWDQLQSAYRVLMFQTDSILCANSNRSVDDFLEWDLIGAPIASRWGQGYNGGLSLRNPKMMLSVTTDAEMDFLKDGANGGVAEDQWFFRRMMGRPDVHMPSSEIAETFSVETIWNDRPLGYHQPERYFPDRVHEIMEWCPEVGLLIKGRFKYADEDSRGSG